MSEKKVKSVSLAIHESLPFPAKYREVGGVDWIIEDHPNADLYFQNQ